MSQMEGSVRRARGHFRARFNSVRLHLTAGFGVLIVLLVAATWLARSSMDFLSDAIGTTLEEVQTDAHLSAQLSSSVVQALEAGHRYVETADPAALRTFRNHGWSAHRMQRELNSRPSQTPAEVALLADIDNKLSTIEVRYALAHRLVDLARIPEAEREEAQGRAEVTDLLATIQRFGQAKAERVAAATRALAHESTRQTRTLVGLLAAAAVLGLVVVLLTVRSVGAPLRALVAHAQRLSRGDLTARVATNMPREFRILAEAMNHTGHSLSQIVSVAARTAENVASSAHQLASVTEQISLSAGQMAGAMSEVSHGAGQQVQQLRNVDAALQTIRERAAEVHDQAVEVSTLAERIETDASAKRSDIDRALAILVDVKSAVERASKEVQELHATAADITRFVKTVSQIAEQTNLLALNAAIEAARAGDAGRGFAVVADEVRKLAEESSRATAAVGALVEEVQTQTRRAIEAVDAGNEVGEQGVTAVETARASFERIDAAVDQMAERVAQIAAAIDEVADGSDRVRSDIGIVAEVAERSSVSTDQVSASTQQTTAATQEITASASELAQTADELESLVGTFRLP